MTDRVPLTTAERRSLESRFSRNRIVPYRGTRPGDMIAYNAHVVVVATRHTRELGGAARPPADWDARPPHRRRDQAAAVRLYEEGLGVK
jgi:hypothetical protein